MTNRKRMNFVVSARGDLGLLDNLLENNIIDDGVAYIDIYHDFDDVYTVHLPINGLELCIGIHGEDLKLDVLKRITKFLPTQPRTKE